jgi:signal peptidase I
MTTSLPPIALRALAMLQVVALVVLVILGSALLAGILPTLVGDESFIVTSRNMQPALQVGDLAVVAPIAAGGLAVGDVVTYRNPPDLEIAVTRRIMSIDTDESGRLKMQTRGDSDPTSEQVIAAKSAVLGRLVYGVPRLGQLVGFANSMAGKILLLGIPALLLGVDYFRSRARRQRDHVVVVAIEPVARRVAPAVSIDDTARIQGLLDSGRRALAAGFPELAARAADAVLGLDPHNQVAAFLKVQAIESREVDREYVAA